jgi:energy-coupling factor transporter ATP-binding protein EcfA2
MYSSYAKVDYYPTFEDREESFRTQIHNLVPRKYETPACYLRDIINSCISNVFPEVRNPFVFITSNPKDCLAFSTPAQVLRAAALTANKYGHLTPNIEEVAGKFNLHHLLDQPLRTLSGGETVITALAKSFIYSYFCDSLIVSSPFCWLSANNIYLLTEVVKKYHGQKKMVKILELEEEDSEEKTELVGDSNIDGLKFYINFSNVALNLDFAVNVGESTSRNVDIENTKDRLLVSPCLFHGDNGAGKSLLGLVLAKAHPHTGDAYVISAGKKGYARVIFQDIFAQKMLRSYSELLKTSEFFISPDCASIYKEIISEFRKPFVDKKRTIPFIGNDERIGPLSLLQTKILLAAIRISSMPGALIIDEPDWGLAKAAAVAFVTAVIKIAHKYSIPVILISHKSWWDNLIHSSLAIKKLMLDEGNFKITMN